MKPHLPGVHVTQAAWKSVMYALVEASCEVLEIARDEVGASLSPVGVDDWSICLFDTVSGGVGHVIQIEANLDQVLAAALRRVSSCECGAETSCYGCLRSYQNQRDHDDLSRGAAEQILRRLLQGTGEVAGYLQSILEEPPDHLGPEWIDLWRDASTAERPLVATLAARGVPLPALGVESAAGIPIPISWPDLLVAVVFGLDEDDVRDLEVEGWTVLPEGPELWDRL